MARANRVVRPEDFRTVVRRGRRSSTSLAVYYRLERDASDPLRFGFIVSRAVGGAVDRNLLRRRLRAVGRQFVDAGASGADGVVRARPRSAPQGGASLTPDKHDP
ncbi:MAG: ribonuclease P protein component, partial [Thermoanaerobaculia bacterium]|nr:ribonuclease P protein component [Thermoanaerobaculia bacterium]